MLYGDSFNNHFNFLVIVVISMNLTCSYENLMLNGAQFVNYIQ